VCQDGLAIWAGKIVVFLLMLLKPGQETPTVPVPAGIQVIEMMEGETAGEVELGRQLAPLLKPATDASQALEEKKVRLRYDRPSTPAY
jgi:hypothetical protein